MAKPRVQVVLAAYNGQHHIEQQLDSILSQEEIELYLTICDDCSTDATPEICRKYASLPHVTYRKNEVNKGTALTFMNTLLNSDLDDFDYYALADQDDVWHSTKLRRAVDRLRQDEAINGSGGFYYSNYVISDLATGDRRLGAVPLYAQSVNSIGTALFHNWVLGCTVVFDHVFRDHLKNYVPEYFPAYHDAWMHLVAQAYKHIVADIDTALIDHQKTGENQTSPTLTGKLSPERISKAFHGSRKAQGNASILANQLLKGFASVLTPQDLETVTLVSKVDDGFLSRMKVFSDRNVSNPIPMENAILKLRLLLGLT